MKKINFKSLIITCVVCLLPIILGIVFYNELPDNVAIHFDINNNPDNYFPKQIFVFAVPVFMTIIHAICCIMYDVVDENKEANRKVNNMVKWLIPLITIVVYEITLLYALGKNIDIRKVVMILLGIIFIVSGNYIPKTVGDVKLNFPRIKNEQVYKKVKRLFGYIFIIDGILFIASILFNPIVSVCLVGIVIIQTIILGIYSIIKNRQEV